jgi:SAM-dependent methyltransferase
MSQAGRLARNRAEMDRVLTGIAERRDLSPAFYSQYTLIPRLLARYVQGAVIDLGCGIMPFREMILPRARLYHGIDLALKSPHMALVGDVQNLAMIASAQYDVALCLEVFEHLPEPAQAVAEMARLLKPGGIAILSAPHLSRIHEAPHDYFRFTEFGLRHLLESNGFVVIELARRGGLCTFLGHQISTLALTAVWGTPLLYPLVAWLNKWLITKGCTQMDRLVDRSGLFALGYVAVAQKID